MNGNYRGILESDLADTIQFITVEDLNANPSDNVGLGACYKCKKVYWMHPTGLYGNTYLQGNDRTKPLCYDCAIRDAFKEMNETPSTQPTP